MPNDGTGLAPSQPLGPEQLAHDLQDVAGAFAGGRVILFGPVCSPARELYQGAVGVHQREEY